MKHEVLELVRGSGNVFRDLKHENADIAQLKAILAVEIINTLDREVKRLDPRGYYSVIHAKLCVNRVTEMRTLVSTKAGAVMNLLA